MTTFFSIVIIIMAIIYVLSEWLHKEYIRCCEELIEVQGELIKHQQNQIDYYKSIIVERKARD